MKKPYKNFTRKQLWDNAHKAEALCDNTLDALEHERRQNERIVRNMDNVIEDQERDLDALKLKVNKLEHIRGLYLELVLLTTHLEDPRED